MAGYLWCPACENEIHPTRVTYDGRHDYRCGSPVVWVKDDETPRLRAENKTLKTLLIEARENVDQDVRELEAVYHGYPEIMERKTAADRHLRDRIDAALAAKGE